MTQQAQTVVRVSERGAATRTALLASAREIFTSVGFTQAGVTDIVTRAGASVGSLYHHFNGKADLYLVLFEDFQRDLTELARLATRRARRAGITDPKQLFLAGARAYLYGCIAERDLARLFVSGDGPPGFDLIMRRRVHDWASKNAEFFARSTDPAPRGDTREPPAPKGNANEVLAVVLTGAIVMAVAEVSLGGDAVRVKRLADGVLQVMSRIEIP